MRTPLPAEAWTGAGDLVWCASTAGWPHAHFVHIAEHSRGEQGLCWLCPYKTRPSIPRDMCNARTAARSECCAGRALARCHSGTDTSAAQEMRIPRAPQQRPAYVQRHGRHAGDAVVAHRAQGRNAASRLHTPCGMKRRGGYPGIHIQGMISSPHREWTSSRHRRIMVCAPPMGGSRSTKGQAPWSRLFHSGTRQ